MATTPFQLKGLDKVSGALRALSQSVPEQAVRALNALAEETMKDAKERCPVLTGTLRRSGKVFHAKPSQGQMHAELTFGTDYAVFVHERMDIRHKNGEAKFLENAVKLAATFFEERIANEINLSKTKSVGAGSPGGTGLL